MEYLPQLRATHADTKLRGLSTQNVINVGDVVLVHSDTDKRTHWPLAVVTKLNMGHDGFVRSAEIKTKNGTTNRPIAKLYPLEVSSCSETLANPSGNDNGIPHVRQDDTPADIPRQKRQAAIGAAKTIKGWTRKLLAS